MRKNQFLTLYTHFCASVSFRQLPPHSAAYFLLAFPRHEAFRVGVGNYLLRPGRDICAKTQFLGIFAHFCAPVRFRQHPKLTSFSHSFPHGSIHLGGVGGYLLRPGWDFCAETQFLALFTHFCDSVSFRSLLPRCILSPKKPSAWDVGNYLSTPV